MKLGAPFYAIGATQARSFEDKFWNSWQCYQAATTSGCSVAQCIGLHSSYCRYIWTKEDPQISNKWFGCRTIENSGVIVDVLPGCWHFKCFPFFRFRHVCDYYRCRYFCLLYHFKDQNWGRRCRGRWTNVLVSAAADVKGWNVYILVEASSCSIDGCNTDEIELIEHGEIRLRSGKSELGLRWSTHVAVRSLDDDLLWFRWYSKGYVYVVSSFCLVPAPYQDDEWLHWSDSHTLLPTLRGVGRMKRGSQMLRGLQTGSVPT